MEANEGGAAVFHPDAVRNVLVAEADVFGLGRKRERKPVSMQLWRKVAIIKN